jgi:hypothetical protein
VSIKKTLARFALLSKQMGFEREKARLAQITHRREVADAFERLNQELIAKIFQEVKTEILSHGAGCHLEPIVWKDETDLHGRNYVVGMRLCTGKDSRAEDRLFSCSFHIHGDVEGQALAVMFRLENGETAHEMAPIAECDRSWLEARIHDFVKKVFAI